MFEMIFEEMLMEGKSCFTPHMWPSRPLHKPPIYPKWVNLVYPRWVKLQLASYPVLLKLILEIIIAIA